MSSSKEVDLTDGPQKCLCDENSCNTDGIEADISGQNSPQRRSYVKNKSLGFKSNKQNQKGTPAKTVNTSIVAAADYE